MLKDKDKEIKEILSRMENLMKAVLFSEEVVGEKGKQEKD